MRWRVRENLQSAAVRHYFLRQTSSVANRDDPAAECMHQIASLWLSIRPPISSDRKVNSPFLRRGNRAARFEPEEQPRPPCSPGTGKEGMKPSWKLSFVFQRTEPRF